MEISVKNAGTGIIAFQHLGTVISLGPGESFKSNLDFTVPEKQVITSQPELVYSNSEEQPVKEEVKTKPEPKKAQPEVAPEEEGDDLPEEEEVEEETEEEQAPAEEDSKEEPKSKKKGNKK